MGRRGRSARRGTHGTWRNPCPGPRAGCRSRSFRARRIRASEPRRTPKAVSAPGGARPGRRGALSRVLVSWLPPEVGRRWRVGAVDVLVAVLAGVLDGAVVDAGAGERVAEVVERARVPRVQVAALAQIWEFGLQHLVVVGAVRVMAIQAVLAHRGVLPEEGAALLGVAGQAELIGVLRLDHLGARPVVRVVAVRAVHPALAHRMVRSPHGLGPHLGVAGEAGVARARRLQLRHGGPRLVDAVTIGAGETAAVVHAPQEVRLAGLVVTPEAGLVDSGRVHRLQGDNRSLLSLFRLQLHVRDDVAVAAGADARQLHVAGVLEDRELLLVTRLTVVDVEGHRRRGRR